MIERIDGGRMEWWNIEMMEGWNGGRMKISEYLHLWDLTIDNAQLIHSTQQLINQVLITSSPANYQKINFSDSRIF